MKVEEVIFDLAELLRVPVLILVLAALALVLVEARARSRWSSSGGGAATRRGSSRPPCAPARRSTAATSRLRRALLWQVAWSNAMAATLALMAARARGERAEDRIAKALADFDYASLRRLERTRLLVRAGPALGLMGTLIPLSPALAGLAEGDVAELSSNLRLAFSITVLGLLIGVLGVRHLAHARPALRPRPLRPRVRRGHAAGDHDEQPRSAHAPASTATARATRSTGSSTSSTSASCSRSRSCSPRSHRSTSPAC